VIISPDVLRHYSHLPLSGVAKVLGISLTAIKKACRSVGVTRWPHCSPNGIEISDSNVISRTNSTSDEESNAEPALSQLKVAQDVASGMLNGRCNAPQGRPPLAVTSSSTFCFTSIQSEVTGSATPRARSSSLRCPEMPEMPRSGPGKHTRVTKRSNKRAANYLDALSPKSKAVGAQRLGKKGAGTAGYAAIGKNSGLDAGGQKGQQPNYGSNLKAVDERRHAGEGSADTISAEESRDAYIAHLEMKLQEATTMAACPPQPPKRMRKQESLTDWSSGNLRKMQDEVVDTGGQCGGIGGIPRYSMDLRHPGLSPQASSVDQDSFADERGLLGGGYRDIFPSQESGAAMGGVGVDAGASKLRQAASPFLNYRPGRAASPFQNYRPGSLVGGQAVAEPAGSTSGMEARHGWAQYLRDPASENMFGGPFLNLPSFGSPQQSPRPFYH
jgi:hypothetical protein